MHCGKNTKTALSSAGPVHVWLLAVVGSSPGRACWEMDTGGCACRVASSSSSSKLGWLRPKGSWFATGHKACSALLCVWWALTAARPLLFTRQAKGSRPSPITIGVSTGCNSAPLAQRAGRTQNSLSAWANFEGCTMTRAAKHKTHNERERAVLDAMSRAAGKQRGGHWDMGHGTWTWTRRATGALLGQGGKFCRPSCRNCMRPASLCTVGGG
jgi:hypothetical protein